MKLSLKSLLLILVFAGVSFVISGCHGLGETSSEHSYDIKRQMDIENQMLVDDWDAIWQKDQTSRLSRYHVR